MSCQIQKFTNGANENVFFLFSLHIWSATTCGKKNLFRISYYLVCVKPSASPAHLPLPQYWLPVWEIPVFHFKWQSLCAALFLFSRLLTVVVVVPHSRVSLFVCVLNVYNKAFDFPLLNLHSCVLPPTSRYSCLWQNAKPNTAQVPPTATEPSTVDLLRAIPGMAATIVWQHKKLPELREALLALPRAVAVTEADTLTAPMFVSPLLLSSGSGPWVSLPEIYAGNPNTLRGFSHHFFSNLCIESHVQEGQDHHPALAVGG